MASNETSEVVDSVGITSAPSSMKPPVPYSEFYWVFSEVVLTIITLFAIYLFVCLARYASITRCNPGREISGKKGKVLYRMCLLSVVMAVARFVADQAVAVTGWQTDTGCLVSVAVSFVFYSLSLYPVYIFLWMRQSIFYANPVLSHVLNPAVTFISWATLVVMLSGGGVLTVMYVIPEVTGWNYVASQQGCQDISNQSGFDLVPTLVVCFTVSFQLSLLALFMYPLLTKKTQRYRGAGHHSPPHTNPDSMSDAGTDGNGLSPSESVSNGRVMTADVNHSSVDNNLNESDNCPSQKNKDVTGNGRHSLVNIDAGEKPSRPGKSGNLSFFKDSNVFYRKAPRKMENQRKKKFNMSRMSSSSISELVKKGRNTSSNSTTSESTKIRKSKRSKTQQGQRVIRFIRKAFILALICVISDVIFTVMQLMIVVPELVYLVLFDVNLLINIICIIMSFRDWPNMIMPMCAGYFREKAKRTSSCCARTHVTKLPLAVTQSRSCRNDGHVCPQNESCRDESSSAKESESGKDKKAAQP